MLWIMQNANEFFFVSIDPITWEQAQQVDCGPENVENKLVSLKRNVTATNLNVPWSLVFYHSIEEIFYCHNHLK